MHQGVAVGCMVHWFIDKNKNKNIHSHHAPSQFRQSLSSNYHVLSKPTRMSRGSRQLQTRAGIVTELYNWTSNDCTAVCVGVGSLGPLRNESCACDERKGKLTYQA